MDIYTSRFNSPNELDYFMSDFEYTEFTTLMSPAEVYATKSGSCHDMVMFEYDELSRQGLTPICKFLIAVGDNGIGGETHSFLYYTETNSVFWFECAWEDYAGILSFDTESELLSFVIDAFRYRNPGGSIAYQQRGFL